MNRMVKKYHHLHKVSISFSQTVLYCSPVGSFVCTSMVVEIAWMISILHFFATIPDEMAASVFDEKAVGTRNARCHCDLSPRCFACAGGLSSEV